MDIKEVPLDQIVDPAFQPRDQLEKAGIEALANSIAELGLINPIVVKPHELGYRLIAGTRRFHAFKMLGKDTITAKIVEEGDREATLIQFCENFHRQDLNPIQTAIMIKFLLEEQRLSTIEIANLCNKSRDWVSKTLSLLEMPSYMVEAIETGQMSASVAQELKRIPNETLKEAYTVYAITGGCTEKTARQWVQQSCMTLAAQKKRLEEREEPTQTVSVPLSPPPEEEKCCLCGAPSTAVVLEDLKVCWHCRQGLPLKPSQ